MNTYVGWILFVTAVAASSPDEPAQAEESAAPIEAPVRYTPRSTQEYLVIRVSAGSFLRVTHMENPGCYGTPERLFQEHSVLQDAHGVVEWHREGREPVRCGFELHRAAAHQSALYGGLRPLVTDVFDGIEGFEFEGRCAIEPEVPWDRVELGGNGMELGGEMLFQYGPMVDSGVVRNKWAEAPREPCDSTWWYVHDVATTRAVIPL